MKNYNMLILLIVLLISLMSCTKEVVIDGSIIQNQDDFNTIENQEGEDDMDHSSQTNNVIYLDQTDTISSTKLWTNCHICQNLKLEDSLIKLDDNNFEGILETNDFFVDVFSELVMSWNVIIDDQSTVTIFIAIGNESGYSQYYTMALWRESYKTSLTSQEDQYGRKTIDTITPYLDDIDRIKFKIVFAKSNTQTTALKNISMTTIPKLNETNYDFSNLEEKSIIVEPRQQLSIPAIGNLICSPTSLSMVLNYYDHSETQSEVAGYIYDQGAQLYGNWSFNASYAGGFDDLYARVSYINDLSIINSYIQNDQPLVLSIRTQQKEDLEGSIMAYPSGHLVVLTGFKLIDDTWYALVNDPAEYEDSKVMREYKLSELLDAWRGYVYIVQTTPF